jgi:hypothetical protein
MQSFLAVHVPCVPLYFVSVEQAFVEPRIRLKKFWAGCGKGFFFPHFGLML